MGTAERGSEIMRILCRRRHETVANLAAEFGVSARTIQRDIETLSLTEPIYTQCGRYDGGVYIEEDYVMDRMYMTASELGVLHRLSKFAENSDTCNLNSEEKAILHQIIIQYTKPK